MLRRCVHGPRISVPNNGWIKKQNEIKIDRREQRHGIDEDDDDDDESDRDLFAVRICFILCVCASLIRVHSFAGSRLCACTIGLTRPV